MKTANDIYRVRYTRQIKIDILKLRKVVPGWNFIIPCPVTVAFTRTVPYCLCFLFYCIVATRRSCLWNRSAPRRTWHKVCFLHFLFEILSCVLQHDFYAFTCINAHNHKVTLISRHRAENLENVSSDRFNFQYYSWLKRSFMLPF